MRALLRFAPWITCLAIGTAYAGDQTVFYDFKPKACPNYFTPPAGGRMPLDPIPTAILGTGELDATNVRTNSLVLIVPGGGGVLGKGYYIYPIDTFLKDASVPVADPTDCKCTDEGPDEVLDLVVRFDPKDLAKALGPVIDGDVFNLCLQGELMDGTPIHGCDCIIIKDAPLAVDSNTWGRTKATYR